MSADFVGDALRGAWSRRPLRLLAGGVLALVVAFLPAVRELPPEAQATAGVATITAWSWLTGALPLPVSSLLPALLLPATGAVQARVVAPHYFPDILLLFLGGFILALALERYGLHVRFALRALTVFGIRPRRVVLGFMAVAALLSMFVSNTSTALLMMPVAVAVLQSCREEERAKLAPPLLLGIAYACSIGGVGTPIGTAPNSVLLGQMRDRFPDAPELAFGTWFLGALPFVVAFLTAAWLVLTMVAFRLPSVPLPGLEDVREQRQRQGPRSVEQNRVLGVFLLVAALWLTRQGADFGAFRIPGWQVLVPERVSETISDATVAMLGVILLFTLPGDGKRTGALLDWEDCVRIPWGILLLLGGGFALAQAFQSSGLSAAVGESMRHWLTVLPPVATIALAALVVTFLTEITSNTATINVLLPLLFSASVAAGVHPMLLAIPTTLAVSCAFMLPVATPPNAILFSTGQLSVGQMARAGILLNLLTAVMVTLVTVSGGAPRWGVDLDAFPAWAR